MRIQFAYQSEDFKELTKALSASAQKRTLPEKPLSQRQFSIWWLVLVAVISALFWIKHINSSTGAHPTASPPMNKPDAGFPAFLGWLAFFEAFVIALAVASIVQLWRQLRRLSNQMVRSDHVQEPTTADLDENGITLAGATSSTRWLWIGFVGWIESPNAFILQLSNNVNVLLPKRAAADAAELDSIREVIRSHVNSPVHGFPVLRPAQTAEKAP